MSYYSLYKEKEPDNSLFILTLNDREAKFCRKITYDHLLPAVLQLKEEKGWNVTPEYFAIWTHIIDIPSDCIDIVNYITTSCPELLV